MLVVLLAASVARAKSRHYDHGTDESSFGLTAHVKASKQEASKCVSLVNIGNSEVEVYNFERPASCLGFSNLSAGMNFKARFALVCKGHFDNCDKKGADGDKAGILIYLPPVVPGAGATIQEYLIVSTRETTNAP